MNKITLVVLQAVVRKISAIESFKEWQYVLFSNLEEGQTNPIGVLNPYNYLLRYEGWDLSRIMEQIGFNYRTASVHHGRSDAQDPLKVQVCARMAAQGNFNIVDLGIFNGEQCYALHAAEVIPSDEMGMDLKKVTQEFRVECMPVYGRGQFAHTAKAVRLGCRDEEADVFDYIHGQVLRLIPPAL